MELQSIKPLSSVLGLVERLPSRVVALLELEWVEDGVASRSGLEDDSNSSLLL
jgi:hypothetical protein